MGRRPKALVAEYFERGAKLDNNSNRYAHTCKKCGEEFPKGRIDTLTGHLLRKCTGISQNDRDWVQSQSRRSPKSLDPQERLSPLPEVQQEHTPSIYRQSALDTLAEVSRHHLDYSSQLRSSDCLHDEPSPAAVQVLNGYSSIANDQDITVLGNQFLHENANLPEDARLVGSEQQQKFPALVQTASAASQHLIEVQSHLLEGQDLDQGIDPNLDMMRIRPPESESAAQGSFSWRQLDEPAALVQHVLLSAPTLPPRSAQKRVRGQFGHSRRREVASIRKSGACLRCRMLKKPCSGETPCRTCRHVETARVWKGGCLRTRIAEEFGLWSTKLFHQRAVEVTGAAQELEKTTLPGRFEIRFSTASSLCFSSTATVYCGEVDLVLRESSSAAGSSRPLMSILDDGHNMSEKLQSYVEATLDNFVQDERSVCLSSTLSRAQVLLKVEESEQAAKDSGQPQQSPRLCYSLQRLLVKNTVELWVLTTILTNPERYAMQLQYHSARHPKHQPKSVTWVAEQGSDVVRSFPPSSRTYQRVNAQLLAAIESRCMALSKTVLNELEHRLLQRQQASRFATLVSAIILLNCVERMTGMYHSFDAVEHVAAITTTTNVDPIPLHPASCYTHDSKKWPLGTAPSALWPQGQRFADLLTMLLRLRGLPPKTFATANGTLGVIQAPSSPVPARPSHEQANEHSRMAAAWLDPMRLDVSDLVVKKAGVSPTTTKVVQSWDMRFIAGVLLPEAAG